MGTFDQPTNKPTREVGPSVQGFSLVDLTQYVKVPLYPMGSFRSLSWFV